MKTLLRQRGGMTLIEIMFAFAILTTILVVAYGAAVGALQSARNANQRSQAQFIAQQQIEQLRSWRDQPSPVFNWYFLGDPKSFTTKLTNTANGLFTIQPCTPVSTTCVWELQESGPVSAVAVGAASDDSDATDYKVVLAATECYLVGEQNSPHPWSSSSCSATNAATIQAVGIEVRVTWPPANAQGIGSLTANTIITQPGAGL